MKRKNILRTLIIATLVFSMTACEKEKNKDTVQESDKSVNIVEDVKQEDAKQEDLKQDESNSKIVVDKVDRFEKVSITDWLDENTVIASKENKSLAKMSLAELSDQYPTSLYLLDINTKEYQLVKEQKEVLLEGASLSQDNKFMLYHEYYLGDPVFYVMNQDTKESFGIMGDPIGGAISAKWADKDTVIGVAYSGGVYIADTSGKINLVEELKEEAIYLVEKINHNIYYTTTDSDSLMKLDMNTKEKVSLNIEAVYDIIPSPDKKQMLILQANGSKVSMIAYDLEGGKKTVITEGTELHSVSWSPNQEKIAYSMKEDDNDKAVRSLYIYDLKADKPTIIELNTEILDTHWSPLGEKLSYTEWDGSQATSNIVYLKK